VRVACGASSFTNLAIGVGVRFSTDELTIALARRSHGSSDVLVDRLEHITAIDAEEGPREGESEIDGKRARQTSLAAGRDRQNRTAYP